MSFWFVDPRDPDRAADLAKIHSIERVQKVIRTDKWFWSYTSEADAVAVYEKIVRLLQESRFRKADLK